MARALTRLSRFDEANFALDEAFDKAVERGDDGWHSNVFSTRGHLEQRRGDFSRAEHWFAKAVELAPPTGRIITSFWEF